MLKDFFKKYGWRYIPGAFFLVLCAWISTRAPLALGNAIDHAHAKGVIVSVSGYEDRAVVEVSDCGEGFDPAAVKPAGSCDERGRGIQLMRLLADAVTISPKRHGTGTVVHLEKLVR